MIRKIVRWFFFKRVELKRKMSIKRKEQSFERDFRNRVTLLAKKLTLQFGDRVTPSFDTDKAYLFQKGLIIAEVTVFRKGELDTATYIVVRTYIEPLPYWWLGLAFAGMKWSVTRLPVMLQLTYENPRGQ